MNELTAVIAIMQTFLSKTKSNEIIIIYYPPPRKQQ